MNNNAISCITIKQSEITCRKMQINRLIFDTFHIFKTLQIQNVCRWLVKPKSLIDIYVPQLEQEFKLHINLRKFPTFHPVFLAFTRQLQANQDSYTAAVHYLYVFFSSICKLDLCAFYLSWVKTFPFQRKDRQHISLHRFVVDPT